MIRWVLVCAFAGTALAQVRARETPRVQFARIEGQVLSDFDDLPLRRAQVVLRPIEAGLTTIGVEGDDKGNFAVRDITPGRYTLLAQRDGYLATSTCLRGALRMPPIIAISSGQQITNLTFRLRPWAVLAGRVKFDDAEPAVGIRIDAYREYVNKGRRSFGLVTAARSNDRGEYRMHGLQPGAYFIAAVYEKAAPVQGYEEQPRTDAEGREVPVLTYTTTFYPNTVKLSEAVPVRVEYGQEVGGIDLFLRALRKVKVRGQVTSALGGQILANAAIVLQRLDAHNSGSLPAPARAVFDREGHFEIRDVTPGPYLITAEGADAGRRLVGRVAVTIAENDLENLELVVSSERSWIGQVRVEGGGRLDPRKALIATLEPRSEKGSVVSAGVRNSSFECSVMPGETYDLYMQNLPDDFYISAIRVNGTDVMGFGLEGGAASHPAACRAGRLAPMEPSGAARA